LNLLNSPFAIEQSESLAQRIIGEVGDEPPSQVLQVWQLCFNRRPSAREQTAAEALVVSHGLAALCRAVINSNEFVHLP
jgi:hypothetical protein